MKAKSDKKDLVVKLVNYINEYLVYRKYGGKEDDYMHTELKLKKIFDRMLPVQTKKNSDPFSAE